MKTGPQNDKKVRMPVLGISSDNLDVGWREDRGFEFALSEGVQERIKLYTEEFARTSMVIDIDSPAMSDSPQVENDSTCKLVATNKRLTGLVDALVKQRKAIVEQLNSNVERGKADAVERERLETQKGVYKTELKILERECADHDAVLKASAIAVELALSSNSERLEASLEENRHLAAAVKVERHRIQERAKVGNEVVAELRLQLNSAKAQLRHEADAHRAEYERKHNKTTKELRRLESESILLRESHRIAQNVAANEKKRVGDLEKLLHEERAENARLAEARDSVAVSGNTSACEFARTDQARRIMKLTRQCDILLSLVRETTGEILSDPLNIGLYSSSC